jgi:hypothetical protein
MAPTTAVSALSARRGGAVAHLFCSGLLPARQAAGMPSPTKGKRGEDKQSGERFRQARVIKLAHRAQGPSRLFVRESLLLINTEKNTDGLRFVFIGVSHSLGGFDQS